MENFTGGWENLEYVEIAEFNKNYRSTKNLADFTNTFTANVTEYIEEKKFILPQDYYLRSTSLRYKGQNIEIKKCETMEDKFNQIINLIKKLTNKGLNYGDICIIYPFNKRRTKTKSVIYFQYLLKIALEEANIPFMISNDDFTNLTYKTGITISNIFSINNLEYKVVILCELEMLYTHSLNDEFSNADALAFLKNINIVYTAINRATEELHIFTLMDETDSKIVSLLKN